MVRRTVRGSAPSVRGGPGAAVGQLLAILAVLLCGLLQPGAAGGAATVLGQGQWPGGLAGHGHASTAAHAPHHSGATVTTVPHRDGGPAGDRTPASLTAPDSHAPDGAARDTAAERQHFPHGHGQANGPGAALPAHHVPRPGHGAWTQAYPCGAPVPAPYAGPCTDRGPPAPAGS
ncbi:hypothetical protein DVA86_32875 [Streptomyces armeniacus]|uniref:Uncharacterized protein n=1 Tax=Streptomyces armeniacus TaxID=83291 RepID=A0A345XYD4_9ACTN|nr:hypothetical protein [Streptomyces armeniacus]AXK36650.1 hypothetical protein DVA86_32875 [Streptomyces armeniacus]